MKLSPSIPNQKKAFTIHRNLLDSQLTQGKKEAFQNNIGKPALVNYQYAVHSGKAHLYRQAAPFFSVLPAEERFVTMKKLLSYNDALTECGVSTDLVANEFEDINLIKEYLKDHENRAQKGDFEAEFRKMSSQWGKVYKANIAILKARVAEMEANSKE